MKLHRRNLLAAGTGVIAAATVGRRARTQANTIKIGLLISPDPIATSTVPPPLYVRSRPSRSSVPPTPPSMSN